MSFAMTVYLGYNLGLKREQGAVSKTENIGVYNSINYSLRPCDLYIFKYCRRYYHQVCGVPYLETPTISLQFHSPNGPNMSPVTFRHFTSVSRFFYWHTASTIKYDQYNDITFVYDSFKCIVQIFWL